MYFLRGIQIRVEYSWTLTVLWNCCTSTYSYICKLHIFLCCQEKCGKIGLCKYLSKFAKNSEDQQPVVQNIIRKNPATESCFPLVLHTVLWENFYNFLEDFLVFRRQVYCTLVYSRGGGEGQRFSYSWNRPWWVYNRKSVSLWWFKKVFHFLFTWQLVTITKSHF